jgi:hypothetical protein
VPFLEPISCQLQGLRDWLMLFVEFLDAKHGMAAAMDTLIGGPEPIYSKTPRRLDVPVKALVSRGVATSSHTICFARSLAWHTLGPVKTGSGKQFGWSIFCSVACSSKRKTTTRGCHADA